MAIFSKKTKQDLPLRRQTRQQGSARDSERSSSPLFQRNRTLTGSLSSRVESAGEAHHADLQSPRTQAHHLVKQRQKLSSVLVGVIGVAILFAVAIYEFTARPDISSVDGALSLDKVRYEVAVSEYLARHPVERLRFVLDKQRLNEYMQQTLPEVAHIEPGGSSGIGTSQFQVTVRKPIASWLIGQSQYYVDATGASFQKNYHESPDVHIVDESGVQQTTGTAIASSRFLTFVGRVVAVARQYGIVVEQATIPLHTTRQVQLKAKGVRYTIKLSLDRPVGEQVEDMQRVISYLGGKKITPQYVDVRVPGRAYYK